VIGLLVLAAGVLALLAEVDLRWVAPAMFAIGVGWNVAFVAATTMLADATEPLERARLLGFSDFVALGGAAIGSSLPGRSLVALVAAHSWPAAWGCHCCHYLLVCSWRVAPVGDVRTGVGQAGP
jgi:hypothetical protein